MAPPLGTDPHHAPVPPGWPGDDDTLPDEIDALDRTRRPPSRPPARPDGAVRSARDRPAQRTGPDGGAAVARTRTTAEAQRPRRAATTTGGRVGEAVRASLEMASDLVRSPGRTPTRHVAPERHRRTVDGRPADDHLDDIEVEGDVEADIDDDLVAGTQPAGRVLVIMVTTLLLAMLVNADALVDRAEQRPQGTARERALAIWHPVQDVSHALQLHRVRQVADWVAGDDDAPASAPVSPRDSRRAPGSPRDAVTPPGADGGGAAPASPDPDAPFDLRTPSEDEPLRLWVGGDFTSQAFGRSLAAAARTTEVVDPVVRSESASGLTRPDYFDWPGALDGEVDEHDPEVVVVALGVNDAQGIVLPDGSPAQLDDPRWSVEYRRRAGELMDQLRAEDRMVVWVGQAPMRSPDFAARMAMINQAYAAEAADRPWVTFVDPATVLGDPSGAYTDALTDAGGAPVEVRQPDGIHLAPAGADLLAAHVLALVEAEVDLGGGAG